ncbi:MAG: hypothetical protein M1838_002805 [Thelocarpon superellum]|nr:MAG: hypothetical protein M1838_002805 [Thelocarpon superellum]
MADPAPGGDPASQAGTGYDSTKPSRFRFKTKRKHRDDDDQYDVDPRPRKSRTRSRSPSSGPHGGQSQRHRHHHRSRHHHRPSTPPHGIPQYFSPDSGRDSGIGMDTEKAFRESLFDALADDEGAAFWEGVYGQPIHIYDAPVQAGPDGELERMTDDEYAAYVRARMYEKTHEAVMEERARRDEARRRSKAEKEQQQREGKEQRSRHESYRKRGRGMDFDHELEASLRRGEERRRKTRHLNAWARYLERWDALSSSSSTAASVPAPSLSAKSLKSRIPWPVESQRLSDLSTENIEQFFLRAPAASSTSAAASSSFPVDPLSLVAILKSERIRWHPDKIQHRLLGTLAAKKEGDEAGEKREDEVEEKGYEEEILKAVTAVFQVVDRLWNEERAKSTEL